MKILAVVYENKRKGGGLRSYTEAVLLGLKARGHEIITASKEEFPGFKNYKFKTFLFLPIIEWRELYVYRFLRKIIKKEGIDLIYCPDYKMSGPGALRAAKSLKIPFVEHYHDNWAICIKGDLLYKNREVCPGMKFSRCTNCAYPERFPWEAYKYLYFSKALKRITQADASLVVSQSLANRLREKGINKNVSVVYSPFDREEVLQVELPEATKNKLAEFVRNKIAVLFVGRLIYHRGVSLILQLAKEMKNNHPELVFVLAGEGEEKKQYEEYALKNNLTNILFLGLVPHGAMGEVYKLSQMVIFPSTLPEPFSRMIIEAMAFSLPVLASNIGGNAEAITDGVNGYLFEPQNVTAAKEKLLTLINNPEKLKAMKEAAYKRSLGFTGDKVIAKIETALINAKNHYGV